MFVQILSQSDCQLSGKLSARILQVVEGTCRLQKSTSVRFGTKIEPGEVLGEISFLEGVKTTASIIADKDETMVYVLEARNLRVLFFRNPGLAGRFYEYLAITLSRRLKNTQNRYYSLTRSEVKKLEKDKEMDTETIKKLDTFDQYQDQVRRAVSSNPNSPLSDK